MRKGLNMRKLDMEIGKESIHVKMVHVILFMKASSEKLMTYGMNLRPAISQKINSYTKRSDKAPCENLYKIK